MDEKLKKRRKRYIDFIMKNRKVRDSFDTAWYVHCRMFGDILEPAFADDAAARLELTAVLNLLTRGQTFSGLRKLEKLHRCCETDEDYAAWFFFMGVCYDRMGMHGQAAVMLTQSAKYEPQFYMVYLMLAKFLHSEKDYDAALGTYMHTIEKVEDKPKRDTVPMVRDEPLIGSIHGNMANCLVMMRRFDDAEYELYEAERFGYDQPMLNLTWAALYAATDRKQLAREKMTKLREELPDVESSTVLMIQEILKQKNSRFYPQKVDATKLDEFWRWFSEHEKEICSALDGRASQLVFAQLQNQLNGIFEGKGEMPQFNFSRDGRKRGLSFRDNYNLTFEIWLEKLADCAPEGLREDWSFYAVH